MACMWDGQYWAYWTAFWYLYDFWHDDWIVSVAAVYDHVLRASSGRATLMIVRIKVSSCPSHLDSAWSHEETESFNVHTYDGPYRSVVKCWQMWMRVMCIQVTQPARAWKLGSGAVYAYCSVVTCWLTWMWAMCAQVTQPARAWKLRGSVCSISMGEYR